MSDRTTVLAKATVPFVILPAIIFALIVVLQFVMLLITSAVLLPSGLAATTWSRFNLFQQSLILLYGLIALALWHAPIYGWLLMVSGWAKRATLLWAVLPLAALTLFEKMAFNTWHIGLMLRSRVLGFGPPAFAVNKYGSLDSLAQLTPGRFLSTPALWIGLILAAVFIAAAVRLRRDREPI